MRYTHHRRDLHSGHDPESGSELESQSKRASTARVREREREGGKFLILNASQTAVRDYKREKYPFGCEPESETKKIEKGR